MTEHPLPGKTAWESQQWLQDRGHHVSAAQAYLYIGHRLETDPNFPVPDGAEAVIAFAAADMQDVNAARQARTEAFAAQAAQSLTRLRAAVAEKHAEIYPRSA